MSEASIPRVYAEALLELAASRDRLELVAEHVAALAELFAKEPDLRTFLESPNVDFADKAAVFESALRGKIADEVLDFLLLVLRRGRQLFFARMLEEFRELHRKRAGVVRARAITAVAQPPEILEELRVALERALGGRVLLESAVDAAILGGFVVRFDGMVIDGSLRRDLERLEEAMRGLKFGRELFHENTP
ncbi:MAG: ATP synthase F1 subunit delta [Planctomycetota bacterium]